MALWHRALCCIYICYAIGNYIVHTHTLAINKVSLWSQGTLAHHWREMYMRKVRTYQWTICHVFTQMTWFPKWVLKELTSQHFITACSPLLISWTAGTWTLYCAHYKGHRRRLADISIRLIHYICNQVRKQGARCAHHPQYMKKED